MREKDTIIIRDRESGQLIQEDVYGGKALRFMYGPSFLGKIGRNLVSKCSFFSAMAGVWYCSRFSKKLILPFIQRFRMDTSIFAEPPESFRSFNDFFTRKLKPASRPISNAKAVIPADGRYLFYQDIGKADGFVVKGQKFSLAKLLGSEELAQTYKDGSMLIARLCPCDYHRFHFPIDCKASPARLINGVLFSVNPWALAHNVTYLTENKRMITELESDQFGKVMYIEIGATNVGSIVQTYDANVLQKKGDEKGYFEFGASCVIVLFEKGKIEFNADLLSGPEHQEVLCLMGQSL